MIKIAYLIQVHKNPGQLQRLVTALQDEHTYFIIHVDLNTDINPFLEIKTDFKNNLFFTENRKKVNWGGFSQVEATIELIESLFNLKISFHFAQFISGQDFPIIAPKQINSFLAGHIENNFINHTALPFSSWGLNGGMDRVIYFWPVDKLGVKFSRVWYRIQKKLGFMRKTNQSGLFGGSSWWTLNKDCLAYILKAAGSESAYFNSFRNTFCADEIYFQTLLLNSPFKDTIISNNLRYINWSKGPQYPRLLDESDYNAVIASGQHFARKIEEHSKLIDLLSQNHIINE